MRSESLYHIAVKRGLIDGGVKIDISGLIFIRNSWRELLLKGNELRLEPCNGVAVALALTKIRDLI